MFWVKCSRNPEGVSQIGYADINPSGLKQFKLLVNASRLDKTPNTAVCPLQNLGGKLGQNIWSLILIYNPSETQLLKSAKALGANCMKG